MKSGGWLFGKTDARFAALPVIAIVGCAIWLMLPQASDAEGHIVPPPEVARVTQDTSRDDGTAGVKATLSDPAPPETAASRSPLDGLRITSQSWRRGGLGSKALVTFTLRNANDFAVKDIEIACAFARRDGSHVTDRRRIIPDTVNMNSRKRYAGMLVGFINVNASMARCSVVTASRI